MLCHHAPYVSVAYHFLAQAYFFVWGVVASAYSEMGCAASVSKCKVVPEMKNGVNGRGRVRPQRFSAASFQLTKEEQIEFQDGDLEIYKSYDWREDDHPSGVPLPPGRKLHEQHLRRMNRFMRKVERLQEQSSLSDDWEANHMKPKLFELNDLMEIEAELA